MASMDEEFPVTADEIKGYIESGVYDWTDLTVEDFKMLSPEEQIKLGVMIEEERQRLHEVTIWAKAQLDQLDAMNEPPTPQEEAQIEQIGRMAQELLDD